jgi:hypothetical protein
MDRFTLDQVATKQVLGDENVFEDIATSDDARVGGDADHDIPCLVTTTLPMPISGEFHCSAVSADN